MINFKIDTNADLWAIEVPKQGGGFMVTTYPRDHKCMPVSNDSFQIISLTNIRLYFGKISDYTVAGVTFTDVNEFATALNGVIYVGVGTSGSSNIDFTPLIDKLDEVIQNDDTNTTNIIDATITEGNETQQAIEDLKTDTNIINGVVNDNLLAGQTASVNIDFLGLVSTENYNVEVKHNYGQSVTMIGQVVENDKVNVQITPQTLLVAPINFDVHVKQNLI
jgi:hypothetical protein